eukprot:129454-Amphidinium_carterae.1
MPTTATLADVMHGCIRSLRPILVLFTKGHDMDSMQADEVLSQTKAGRVVDDLRQDVRSDHISM